MFTYHCRAAHVLRLTGARGAGKLALMDQEIAGYGPVEADLSNRLFFRLYQCANMLNKTGTRALEAHHLTTQQWAIIGALGDPRNAAGIAVGDLAAHLMVSRQNLTGVLSRMQAQGMVERAVSTSDSRSRLIRLSGKGRRLWEAMQPDIAAFYEASLDGFSRSDLIHMLHYLDKLRDNFRRLDQARGESD